MLLSGRYFAIPELTNSYGCPSIKVTENQNDHYYHQARTLLHLNYANLLSIQSGPWKSSAKLSTPVKEIALDLLDVDDEQDHSRTLGGVLMIGLYPADSAH